VGLLFKSVKFFANSSVNLDSLVLFEEVLRFAMQSNRKSFENEGFNSWVSLQLLLSGYSHPCLEMPEIYVDR